MRGTAIILGALAGATALTLAHETMRRIDPDAPRMDLLAMDALAKSLLNLGGNIPDVNKLFYITMAGDIASNALYYSLSAIGNEDNILARGAILGTIAGLGAVFLPKPLGLIEAPSNRTNKTRLLTVGLYLFGGIIASTVIKKLTSNRE